MTCIVAIKDNGIVHMAGERANSDSDIIISSKEAKVFDMGFYLLGYCGEVGIAQSIVYNFKAPEFSTKNIKLYMQRKFMKALRQFVKEQWGDRSHESALLIGIKNTIWEISLDDFQCLEYDELAIGTGGAYAIGSLYSNTHLTPKDRCTEAIEAAIKYSPDCCGPIDYLSK